MATIHYGTPDTVVNAIYGATSYSSEQYIKRQVRDYRENVSDRNRHLVDRIENEYRRETTGDLARAAERLRGRISNYFSMDKFVYLDQKEKVLNPPPIMMDSIMAYPKLRRLYLDDRIEAYDDYIDKEPDAIGMSHRDYRKITNGICIKEDDRTLVRETFEPYLDTDKRLSKLDQIAALRTWGFISSIIDDGYDPLSENNDLL